MGSWFGGLEARGLFPSGLNDKERHSEGNAGKLYLEILEKRETEGD